MISGGDQRSSCERTAGNRREHAVAINRIGENAENASILVAYEEISRRMDCNCACGWSATPTFVRAPVAGFTAYLIARRTRAHTRKHLKGGLQSRSELSCVKRAACYGCQRAGNFVDFVG